MQPRTERFSTACSSLALDALMQLPKTALVKQKQQAHLALALRKSDHQFYDIKLKLSRLWTGRVQCCPLQCHLQCRFYTHTRKHKQFAIDQFNQSSVQLDLHTRCMHARACMHCTFVYRYVMPSSASSWLLHCSSSATAASLPSALSVPALLYTTL
jgi:hypothetical protein